MKKIIKKILLFLETELLDIALPLMWIFGGLGIIIGNFAHPEYDEIFGMVIKAVVYSSVLIVIIKVIKFLLLRFCIKQKYFRFLNFGIITILVFIFTNFCDEYRFDFGETVNILAAMLYIPFVIQVLTILIFERRMEQKDKKNAYWCVFAVSVLMLVSAVFFEKIYSPEFYGSLPSIGRVAYFILNFVAFLPMFCILIFAVNDIRKKLSIMAVLPILNSLIFIVMFAYNVIDAEIGIQDLFKFFTQDIIAVVVSVLTIAAMLSLIFAKRLYMLSHKIVLLSPVFAAAAFFVYFAVSPAKNLYGNVIVAYDNLLITGVSVLALVNFDD